MLNPISFKINESETIFNKLKLQLFAFGTKIISTIIEAKFIKIY